MDIFWMEKALKNFLRFAMIKSPVWRLGHLLHTVSLRYFVFFSVTWKDYSSNFILLKPCLKLCNLHCVVCFVVIEVDEGASLVYVEARGQFILHFGHDLIFK